MEYSGQTKSVLFIVQHPAHVHQFKYLIAELSQNKHKVKVLAIDKEITCNLLEKLGIEYEILSTSKNGLFNKILDIFPQFFRLHNYVKKNKSNVMVTRGNVAACLYSGVSSIKHIIFSDSEPVFIDRYLIKLATTIITPDIFRKNYGRKHKRIKSYKEFAYLHPSYFKVDSSVHKELGIGGDEMFFILRFVAWKANHDVGESGMSMEDKSNLVNYLSEFGKVFISSEKQLPDEFEKFKFPLPSDKMHDALSFATLFVGDSQTMTTESAILGTPAIRINSFVGENDMANFIELEKEYGLIFNFRNYSDGRSKIEELLSIPDLKKEWREKSNNLIADKVNLNEYMLQEILKSN